MEKNTVSPVPAEHKNFNIVLLLSLLFLFLISSVYIITYMTNPGVNINLNKTSEKSIELSKKEKKKILLVHSYHPEYEWVASITRGVKMALMGSQVELEIFYMDTKRKTDEEWKISAGKKAAELVMQWHPDVVIVADDNGQKYFASNFAGKSYPQFVFCGVNEAPEIYGYPAENITGILERPHIKSSIKYLKKLLPEVKNIAFITDNSPTSMGVIEHIKKEKITNITYSSLETFEEWKKSVIESQDSADAIAVYTYHTIKKNSGDSESISSTEVINWTLKNSKIPVFGFLTFAVDDGVLCGYLESGVEHGFKSGEMALEILNGKKAADIPIIIALEGQSMLNLKAAKKWGIKASQEIIKDTDLVIGE